jgi:hypothetical protein
MQQIKLEANHFKINKLIKIQEKPPLLTSLLTCFLIHFSQQP